MKKNKLLIIFTFIVSVLFIFGLGFAMKSSTAVNASGGSIVYEQYETPDYVSIQEITGKNKISLLSNTKYSYTGTAPYGSLVFQFELENNRWTSDENMQVYLMVDDPEDERDPWWQSHNYFWFQADASFMMQDGLNGKVRDNHKTDVLSSGNHRIRLGRIAIKETDQTFKNRYYCFMEIDGVIQDECINTYEPSILLDQIYITGREANVNKLIDYNWTGNEITFVSNKQQYGEVLFTKSLKISAPADPTAPEGKTFIGWFDDLGNQWDFDTDEVMGNMTLTAGFTSTDSQALSDEEYFENGTYTPVLRFTVSSDNHITDSSAEREARLRNIFSTAYSIAESSNTYTKLDAALFAGDLSDDGSDEALQNWKKNVDNSIKDGTALIVSMGNHEFRTYDSVTREVKVFEEIMEQKCDYHVVINGFHFIALSPNLNEGYNFSEAKVEWLDEQLAIAAEDTPNKPIFVMQHENIKGTVYGSIGWGMDELTEVLCKYPQVVDFSGHSHYPLADPRSVWQGTFTAFNTGTTNFYEIGINGYKNGGVFPSDKSGGWSSQYSTAASTAEFQIVEIDANNAMRVIVYDLINNREIRRYYMRNLLDERKLTYSHTERAKNAEKPYFAENAVLTATAEENTVNLQFNQALCDDIVESYRIEIYKRKTLVQTNYALSDYFFDAGNPELMNNRVIKVSIPNLGQNTEYTIKVYAVNVWNQQSDNYISATVKTGNIVVYEDVVEKISLYDLYSGSSQMNTDNLNSYKPVHFKKSEENVYGSFELEMQLKYVGADFQICFDEEFNNYDLIWIKTDTGVWFIKEDYKSINHDFVLQPGLYTVIYRRSHSVEGNTAYTTFSIKFIQDDKEIFYHEYKSTGTFTNNGYFSLNFNSCFAAGSRYYDKSDVIPRTTTPEFEEGDEIVLSTPITNWIDLGGAITFDSKSSSLEVWLEDSEGRVTNNKTFSGTFTLGNKGDYYHYEIKTNKFDATAGVTGNENIVKFCFNEANFEIGNLDILIYEEEQYAEYDEISILDIVKDVNNLSTNGIYSGSPVEHGIPYNGTSSTYSAVLRYYLVCDDISGAKSEFRSQLGTLWSYACTLWFQPGKTDVGFFGFQYSTRPTDKYILNLKSHTIYLVETGVIRIEKGEWAGWNYTYFKIDGELITGFYVPANECKSTSYQVAFKIVDGYKAADISLARNIEYIVDGQVYKKQLAISGANIYEPTTPTKQGYYFTGWYTKPEGGERVDFSKIFTSEDSTVKYYARFSNELCNVTFISEGNTYDTQAVGKGGQALEPNVPSKLGTYKYSFVNWVIQGTDTVWDFTNELTGDVTLEAVFEEYRYSIVYRVDGITYDTKQYLESDPTTIIGGEPTVPTLKGATGYWDYAIDTRTKGDTYAIARYNGASIDTTDAISLVKYNGAEVDIADDLTRYYLNFADSNTQAEWLASYPVSGGHEIQDISFSWADDSGNTNYLVYFADNAEFNNAFIVKTNKTTVSDVGIFTPGNTYYWKVVGLNTNKASAVDTFKILNTPVRWISAGTVYNMRDVGGWTTTDGKQVKYGMFFRGGQLSLDQSGEASYMNDLSKKVFDYLGIKTEIELRGESTHTNNQINDLEKLIYVNGQGYMQIFKLDAKTIATYRNLITEISNPDNYPFYFHCSWGADRTGFVGFTILSLLGVPYEQLVQDFELTSLSRSGRRARVATGFESMVARLLEDYGDENDPTNLQKAVENYYINFIGVTKSEIDSLRSIMLEEATEQATSHIVTYRIDGQEYLKSKIFDGGKISSVAPVYFEKHLDHWEVDGVPYDFNTPVTQDLVLDAVFADTLYEDYDVVTIRDLANAGDSWTPCISEPFTYQGYSVNNSRIFEFDYEIRTDTGSFDDGVHIEFGSTVWLFKAHIWLAGGTTIHIFTNGTETPTLTCTYNFEYGKTYHVKAGVVYPINGEYAGEKMLFLIIDDEVVFELPTSCDISSTKAIGMAGTQGILHSTDNKMNVVFNNANGEEIETVEVTRGTKATAIENPTAPTNKKFIGWYDELGNKWDFDTDVVYKDVKLFAKFGDFTVNALVLDDNDFEVVNNCEVVVGSKVSDLTSPSVASTLEFDGWYNGTTKLNDNDIITENMDLICRFKVVKSDEPTEPVDPVEPVVDDKGCKGSVTNMSLVVILVLLGSIVLKKKRSWSC